MKTIQDFYSDIIFKRTYAKRQNETWQEAVDRYANHFRPKVPNELKELYEESIQMVKDKKIVPSMRGIATAGKALELYPEAIYNCSYLIFNSWRSFADLFILLMLGVGVGYSVEKHTIKLPKRHNSFYHSAVTITPEDSKEGWRDSFYSLLTLLSQGQIPQFDFSKIRPAGTPLKTFGGTASGKEPLEFLFNKTIELFVEHKGEEWKPIEVFDLANLVANAVISGGVRRSACIALVDKEEANKFKPNGFWDYAPWRAYSNISVTTEPDDWDKFFGYLSTQGTGEPGIYNRQAAVRKAKSVGREFSEYEVDLLGSNPCGEVILRPFQTCNLTEVHVEPNDTFVDLATKVRGAVILGAIQHTTTFNGVLTPDWHKTAIKEPLLGVSLTGLRTNKILKEVSLESKQILSKLKAIARETAVAVGKYLGKQFRAVTTVKPSGTTSQILGTTAGLHPTYSRYFIRRLRINRNDPLVKQLEQYKSLNLTTDIYNNDTLVMEFPLEHPNHKERSAIDQLEYYKMMADYWVDHNPSCTITVKHNEWDKVKEWIKKHYDTIVGITILPEAHDLPQAPYEKISKEEYEKRKEAFMVELKRHNGIGIALNLPNLAANHTYACSSGGSCDINEL
jgi:ribonucleoside-triphosphate reductase